MATVNINRPNVTTQAGTTAVVPLVSYSVGPTTPFKDGDALVSTNGLVGPAGPNPTAIVGFATHDSGANYAGFTNGAVPRIDSVFGISNVNTPAFSAAAAQALVAPVSDEMFVEINLLSTVQYMAPGTVPGANQVVRGSLVGLNQDPVTGWYVADPNATNKIAIIREKVRGPGFGALGDFGARVQIKFLAAGIQIP